MSRFNVFTSFVFLALLGCASASFAQDGVGYSEAVRAYVRVDAPAVALRDVTILDGTGAPAASHQVIVIANDTIAAVGSIDDIAIPAHAQVLHLAGHTVTPGFIGVHNHTHIPGSPIMQYSAPRLYLGAGVTTIQTTGAAAPYAELNLQQSIQRGDTPGPDIFASGPYFTGPGGNVVMIRPTDEAEARRAVRYWAEAGVTWIKLYRHTLRAHAAAIIEEAHQHGLKVTGHLCSITYREAAALGIDRVEHGLVGSTDHVPGKQPDTCPPGLVAALEDLDLASPEVQATFDALIEHGVAMTSTLAIFETNFPGRPEAQQRALDAMAPHAVEAYRAYRERMRQAGDQWRFKEALFEKSMAYEVAFVKAGGLLAAGVDPGRNNLPGFGDQRNYELFIEAGFVPTEAIQIMTLNGAKVLGIDDVVGTIAPGKRADLVVIDGDIQAQPETIRHVRLVFKKGIGYDAERLIEDARGMVGLR